MFHFLSITTLLLFNLGSFLFLLLFLLKVCSCLFNRSFPYVVRCRGTPREWTRSRCLWNRVMSFYLVVSTLSSLKGKFTNEYLLIHGFPIVHSKDLKLFLFCMQCRQCLKAFVYTKGVITLDLQLKNKSFWILTLGIGGSKWKCFVVLFNDDLWTEKRSSIIGRFIKLRRMLIYRNETDIFSFLQFLGD